MYCNCIEHRILIQLRVIALGGHMEWELEAPEYGANSRGYD